MVNNKITLDKVKHFANCDDAKQIEEFVDVLKDREDVLNTSIYLKTFDSGKMQICVYAFYKTLNRSVKTRVFNI